MDSANYKDVQVSRGYTYHYYYSPASTGKPTLFFIHGFPSSSFDWSRQVAFFKPKGYGLLVPDCLGSGGTSKPTDYYDFRWKLQAQDLIDVLDAEKPSGAVVGIAHDWGSQVLSALVYYHEDRFAGFAWAGLGYIPPHVEPWDIRKTLAWFKSSLGSDVWGYWLFFNEPGSHVKCQNNIDSFLQLLYPDPPETWLNWLCPVDKAREWVESDRKPGRASWLTEHEYATLRENILKSGLRSAMNYYAAYTADINLEDFKALPRENWNIKKPTLFIAATRDFACRAELQKVTMKQYAPHAEVVELDTGHWAFLEATEQFNNILVQWIQRLPVP